MTHVPGTEPGRVIGRPRSLCGVVPFRATTPHINFASVDLVCGVGVAGFGRGRAMSWEAKSWVEGRDLVRQAKNTVLTVHTGEETTHYEPSFST